jgi:signal transduction histidine kinase
MLERYSDRLSPERKTVHFQKISQSVGYMTQLLEDILIYSKADALKYSPNGDPVDFELNREENQAIIIIRDRGIGIPPNDQVHLFEPFHRTQNTGTINGTGLGLAIVKKAVDLHQGKISVQSKIDIGTTFTVKLPLLNVKKF